MGPAENTTQSCAQWVSAHLASPLCSFIFYKTVNGSHCDFGPQLKSNEEVGTGQDPAVVPSCILCSEVTLCSGLNLEI